MSSATLPVPVQMELPSLHWRRVDPEAFGVGNVGMLAVRAAGHGDYVPTLAVDGGILPSDDSLEKIAEEFLLSVRDQFDQADLVKRRVSGTKRSPAILQLIEIEEQRNDRRFDLQQVQVIQSIRDVTRPLRQIVLSYTMIGEFKHAERLRDDFSTFMESVVILPE